MVITFTLQAPVKRKAMDKAHARERFKNKAPLHKNVKVGLFN